MSREFSPQIHAFRSARQVLMTRRRQFFIIGGAGAVESTVVGHAKTCLIVVIGAFTGGRVITDKAALGILLALCSIFAYVFLMFRKHNSTKTNFLGPGTRP